MQRESLIDALMRDRNGRAAYCILFSVLFIYSVIVVIGYLLDPKRRDADVNALIAAFPNFEYSAACWLVMLAILLVVVYPATRTHVKSGFKAGALYSLLMFLCAIALIVLPILTILHFQTRYFATGILLIEQLRLLMKMIDYVSVNKDKDPKRKKKDRDTEMSSHSASQSHSHSHAQNNNDDDLVDVVVPKFSQFLYFLCAPTLLYRDDSNNNYAEGKRSIFSIIVMGIEMDLLLLAIFRFTRFVGLHFSQIGFIPYKLPDIVDLFLLCCILGVVYFVSIHFVYAHLTQNISANLLKFGDRRFYDDYWSVIDPGLRAKNYCRIVADWLDVHVYNPVVAKTNNKGLGSIVVMLVTAAALEYIVSFSNGFILLLVSSLMFTFAPALLMHKAMNKLMEKSPKGYTFVLFVQTLTIVFFMGLMIAAFTAESYSRTNCSRKHGGVRDVLIPRTLDCITLTAVPDGLMKKLLSYSFRII